ncbi:MAG: carbohydrate ABC transporter permease, partial [Mesorhizobium sp.]
MGYLQSLPRRVVTVYLPLLVFVIVLLFPFYWMTITAIKPNHEMTDYANFNPFWVVQPTFQHIRYLLFDTSYPGWLLNTIIISTAATFLSLLAAV